jgi:hypothetical protein
VAFNALSAGTVAVIVGVDVLVVVEPVVVVPAVLTPVTASTSEPTVFKEFTRLVRLPIEVVLPVLLMPKPCRAVVKPVSPARWLALNRDEKSRVSWFPVLLVAVEAVKVAVDWVAVVVVVVVEAVVVGLDAVVVAAGVLQDDTVHADDVDRTGRSTVSFR